MRTQEQQYGLWTLNNRSAVPLRGMHVHAEVQNLLSEVSITQTYRNEEAQPIEAVYTFPLPLDAVLLAFSVKLGDKHLQGVVQERLQAEEQYEEAITDGDAAVMLQQVEPGLFIVTVGNLLPKETAIIEFRYALLHHWTDDVLRWYLPTVLSPRYGQPALEPHQIPEIDLTVEHLYTLTVSIKGLLRQSKFECPSHAIDIQELADQTRIQLKDGRGLLDRDLILLMRQTGDKVSAVCDQDGDHYVALASFCPQFPEADCKKTAISASRVIKILVDCSGSMSGESIAQARIALLNILDSLQPKDRFSFIRFGSHVAKEIATPIEATAINISLARETVARMEADLGGTEIIAALAETLHTDHDAESADVLLITDGEVWDETGKESRSGKIIKLANETGQRIFTVGVGNSVSERLVRELAEQTQGACELVNPGEGMAEKIERHFKRIYLPQAESIHINWPTAPEWQQRQKQLFAGDTLHVFAKFKKKPNGCVSLNADFGKGVEWTQSASIQANTPTESMSTLARLTANTLIKEETSRDESVRIAIEYQLMCEHTAYLVIDVRSEALKTDGMPALRKVPTMLASGWGGLGRTSLSMVECCSSDYKEFDFFSKPKKPTVMGRRKRKARVDDQLSKDLDFLDIPAFLRRQADVPDTIISTDSIWKYQNALEIYHIVNSGSLSDLQAFGISNHMLDQLKEILHTSTAKVSEHQLIVAFFYLLMTSRPVDIFNDGTRSLVKRAFKEGIINDALFLQIKDLIVAMDNTCEETECPK